MSSWGTFPLLPDNLPPPPRFSKDPPGSSTRLGRMPPAAPVGHPWRETAGQVSPSQLGVSLGPLRPLVVGVRFCCVRGCLNWLPPPGFTHYR